MKGKKLEQYRIANVEALLLTLEWGTPLFDAISDDYDEDESSLNWTFNPHITDAELEAHGVEIKVHVEHDLPSNCWGVDLIGDEDNVATSLTNEFIGDNEISDELYAFIKRQFKNNLPILK